MAQKNTKVLKQLKKMRIRRPRLKILRTPTFRFIFIHCLIFVAFFLGTAWIVNNFGEIQNLFWWVSSFAFLMGVLHTWLVYVAHEWTHHKDWGVKETLFTLLVYIVGAVTIYFGMTRSISFSSYATIATFSTVSFVLPFFWERAFKAHRAIPEKIYPPMTIETLEDVLGKITIEPNNKGIVWRFEEGILREEYYNMYMPHEANELTIEQLFKVFIIHYNTNVSDEPFIFIDKGTPIKWQLYHRPWWALSYKVVDHTLGIEENSMSLKKRHRSGQNEDIKKIRSNEILVTFYREDEIEKTSLKIETTDESDKK